MDKINLVESSMEKTRANAAEDMEELAAESKELRAQLDKLEFEIEVQA